MENIIERLQDKRLFFTVTTGRSGTGYLSYLLGLLKDFKSEHESIPGFHQYYRDIMEGKYSFEKFWTEHKLPYIANLKEGHYSDVSHMVCKGFIESLVEMGIKPSIIFLRRNNRDVAKSLLELGTIPMRTQSGLTYLSSPFDSGALPVQGGTDDLSDYQLCYWYTLDIDRRATFYKEYLDQHHCSFISFSFEELIKGDPLGRMKKAFDIPGFSFKGRIKYWKNKRKVRNSKTRTKKAASEINWENEEKELMERIYEF